MRQELDEISQKDLEFYKTVAFVKDYTYNLFGYYSITKTKTCYEFTLRKPAGTHQSWLDAIGKVTIVPLSQDFGCGDWENVTPEKIMDLSVRIPLTVAYSTAKY